MEHGLSKTPIAMPPSSVLRVRCGRLALIVLLSNVICAAGDSAELTIRSLFGINQVATKSSEFADQFDVFSLAFTPDGTKLATSSPNNKDVHIWAWQGDVPRLIQVYHQGNSVGGNMNGLQYSPNGDLLASAHGSGQNDQIIRIWNTSNGAIAGDITDQQASSPLLYASVAFSPDGKLLIRSQPGASYMQGSTQVILDSFIVHDTTTWKPIWALSTAPVFVTSFGASHNGHYALIAGQERLERSGSPYLQPKILLVDLAGKRVIRSANILVEFFEVPFVAWSPDDRRFTLGGSPGSAGARLKTATVETFDAQTGQQLGEYTRDDNSQIRALMYSPDGNYLMIGWDKDVEIWDAAHKKLLQKIAGDVNAASFSPNGRYLAISTGAHGVSVWTMEQVHTRTSSESLSHK